MCAEMRVTCWHVHLSLLCALFDVSSTLVRLVWVPDPSLFIFPGRVDVFFLPSVLLSAAAAASGFFYEVV